MREETEVPVTLECRDLRKRYPDQSEPALGSHDAGVSFQVEQGELFALLGPSGCGKTTTLRIVGGFATPDAGHVLIDGEDVTRRPPYKRPTNTVFQSYALFPHMRLGANVEFGLKMARVPKAERERRASEALALVGLGGWERRRVTELSGGQQQRAALARAMANRPSVLLLDEPLGALDLKLRRQMQDELVRLKGATKTTFIHVTHDQEEACAIADRIAIMDRGHIVQVDTPLALYREPRTSYVAQFINVGTVLRGAVSRASDWVEVAGGALAVRGRPPRWLNGSTDVAAVLPHDRARVRPAGAGGEPGHGTVAAVVERVVFTGTVFDVYARTEDGVELRAAVGEGEPSQLAPGDAVEVSWAPEDVLFVRDSESRTAPEGGEGA
jgi:ABC-type Fe3+/spermidine/putrescine transport system ATPase subunit